MILQPTGHIKIFSDYYLGCNNTWRLHPWIRHCPELPQVKGNPPAKHYCWNSTADIGPAAIRAGLSERVAPAAINDKGHKIYMRRGTLVTVVRGKDCNSNYNWNCKQAVSD